MKNHFLLIGAACCIYATPALGSDSLSHGEIPDGEVAHSTAARVDFRASRFADAAAIYQAMADAHPGSLFAWSNLGVTLFQLHKFKEARDALHHAVEISPNDPGSLTVLGITNYELGSFTDAIDNLKAAVALTPTDSTAHEYLGASYEAAGFKQEAKAERRTAEELDEDAVESRKPRAPVAP
jgi:Flp pilus assembly protein TadD